MFQQGLGICATIISIILWFPQAHLVWKFRNTPQGLISVSIGTIFLSFFNTILWAWYAFMSGVFFWVGASVIITGPVTLWMLIVLRRNKNIKSAHSLSGCPEFGIPHNWFITAPAGFGTIFAPCNGVHAQGFPLPPDITVLPLSSEDFQRKK